MEKKKFSAGTREHGKVERFKAPFQQTTVLRRKYPQELGSHIRPLTNWQRYGNLQFSIRTSS